LIQYDRTLLVADPRRMEPKKVRRCRRQKFDWALIFFVLVRRKGSPIKEAEKLQVELYGVVWCIR
jgi:hypothetical protein